jgi:zinc protease
MTAPALLAPTIDPATVVRHRLDNGLTVLVRRDVSAPVVAVVTYVKAGYFDETDDVVGIAHVLEHMYFKGTPALGVGEISKQTKAAGGYLNAGTIYDHTSYYTVLPASGFVRGLEIQADAYANSVIEADELRRELEVIIQEAKRKSDNPTAVVTETLFEVLHDEHRMRRWRIGREPGLRRLTQDDLLRFYRNFYRPSNTVLVIVGDVDPDEALAHVRRLYGPLADGAIARVPGPDEPARREFRYRELDGDVQQTETVIGWRTVPTMHPDAPRLDLAAAVLGSGRASRLYQAVRERQLASGVSAYNYTPTELGVFVVHLDGAPERATDAARAAWDQVRRLRDEGVAPPEVERARRIFEAQWMRRVESMEGQANYLAEWEALGDFALGDGYRDRLLGATADEVTDAAAATSTPTRRAWWCTARRARPPSPATARRCARSSTAPAPAAPGARAARAAPGRAARRARGARDERRAGARLPHRGRRADPRAAQARGARGLRGRVRPRRRARRAGGPRRTEHPRRAHLGEGHRAAHGAADRRGRRAAGRQRVGVRLRGAARLVGERAVRHLPAALELLADVVQRPVFPAEAIETERGVLVADIAAQRDDMYRYPTRLLLEAAFGDHPYGRSVLGTEESLAGLTADDARDWHRRAVLEAPLVIAVVGDVDADDTAAIIARDFDRLRPRDAAPVARPAWPAGVVVHAQSREKAQTALALAFAGPARDDDRRYVGGLVAGIASGLGGRFFDELRDRQSLAYTVQAYSAERALAGMFVSYIATSPEKEETARAGAARRVREAARDPGGRRTSWSGRRPTRSGTHADPARRAAPRR